jgi:hypothetical protein
MSKPLPLRKIFAAPLLICVLGVIGLVSALTGDGWRDVLSWAGLAVPLIATGWAMAARRT